MSPPTASSKLSNDNVQSSSSSSAFLEIATKRIYDDLIESICSNIIASELHQRIKNGEIPLGDLSYTRQQLYPTIYNRNDIDNNETSPNVVSDHEVRIELDKYAVQAPLSSCSKNIIDYKRKINNDSLIDADEKRTKSVDTFNNKSNESKLTGSVSTNSQSPLRSLVTNGESKGSGGVSTRQQSSALTTQQSQQLEDIWGNIPLKEPKELLLCPVCHRSINALRFAPHLEKCMGIHYASGFVDDDDDTDVDETE